MAEKLCPPTVRAGRLGKARQFRDAADIVEEFGGSDADLNDAYITLCVHAGIAAADVICCIRLGVHHQGESHNAAVALLARVEGKLAIDLDTLLRSKTESGYSERASSTNDRRKAKRAMGRLVDAAVAAGAA